jgi:hypothetical protein
LDDLETGLAPEAFPLPPFPFPAILFIVCLFLEIKLLKVRKEGSLFKAEVIFVRLYRPIRIR